MSVGQNIKVVKKGNDALYDEEVLKSTCKSMIKVGGSNDDLNDRRMLKRTSTVARGEFGVYMTFLNFLAISMQEPECSVQNEYNHSKIRIPVTGGSNRWSEACQLLGQVHTVYLGSDQNKPCIAPYRTVAC
jgi:hypothetical protein